MNKNLEMLVKEVLKKDEAFADQICEAKDAQEIVEIFAAKEIELTEEEAQELMRGLQQLENGNDELEEADLENVAGGWAAAVIIFATAVFIYKVHKMRVLTKNR